jgi:SAM-dependent methyltransferase
VTGLSLGACDAEPPEVSAAQPGALAATDTLPPSVPPDSFPAPDRPVADIVAARWTDEDARDDLGEAVRVMDLTRIEPGMTVADIGAGDGYYALRLGPRLGRTGKVFAEDITPRYLDMLGERIERNGIENVVVVRGLPHDPRLPPASVDVALMIHMYHEVEQPYGLLWHLAGAMRPDGRVAILDPDRPTAAHGTPLSLLRCELRAVGFGLLRVDTLPDGAYLAQFRPPAPRPTPAEIRQRVARERCAQRNR